MNFLNNIQKTFSRFFNRFKFHELSLSFRLDQTEDDLLQLSYNQNQQDIILPELEKLLKYNYKFKNNNITYMLDYDSFRILNAACSQDSSIINNNKVRFKYTPRLLLHLKDKKNIKQSQTVQKIKVSKVPYQPAVKMDYNQEHGLIVTPVFSNKKANSILSKNEINRLMKDSYVKIDSTYYPVITNINSKTQKFFQNKPVIISDDDIPNFFKEDFILLKSKLGAILSKEVEEINIIDKPMNSFIKVKMLDDGWLEMNVNFEIGDYVISGEEVNENDKDYLKYDESTWLKINKRLIEATRNELKKNGFDPAEFSHLIPVSLYNSIEEFTESIGGKKELSSGYQDFLESLGSFALDENFKLPANIESTLAQQDTTLRPYQRSGVQWMIWLSEKYLHGLLADDMGLGKTIQTILALRYFAEQNPTDKHSIVVCPKSVIRFWKTELKRFFPESKVCEYTGGNRDKMVFLSKDPTIIITNYESISIDIKFIERTPIHFLILDEATKIKNPNSKRTKAIKKINALHRVALSGTPIENNLSELWSLFDFLLKGHLGTHGKFKRLFSHPIMSGDDYTSDKLSNKIRPFFLRRIKEDVAKDLPEKIEIKEWCELTREQIHLYKKIYNLYAEDFRNRLIAKEKVTYVNILPILIKLKQICDHPGLLNGILKPLEKRSEKFDLINEKISNIKDNGEKIVLFSHFLKALDIFEQSFSEHNISYVRIDGSTENRQEYIDQFNNDNIDVALCSIQACGYGINLTSANHVFHFDRWWNPATENQATDRVHRIGQDKIVYVYKILTLNTIEERIDSLIQSKLELSDNIIGRALKKKMQWTREELLEILKPI